MVADKYNFILVGGGLQNGLIALALKSIRPSARIAIVEREATLGGNHTWCFHKSDVSREAFDWIMPLVCHRWPAHVVRFPGFERTIEVDYSAITSDRFDAVVRGAIEGDDGSDVFTGSEVVHLGQTEVELKDGLTLKASVVIDARGPSRSADVLGTSGFQKFVGLELRLSNPHDLQIPTLIDATVDQTHGFRFIYTLPLGPDTLLIEDTYFHQSPELDKDSIRNDIMQYARRYHFDVKSVVREETGVLPMPWSGLLPSRKKDAIVAGYGGGWFHPATGYSLPVAARVAEYIAATPLEELMNRGLDRLLSAQISQARYCHLLNQFLFCWYPPDKRWHIFARFYRLPLGTIERFYALQMTLADKLRLLVGKPPRGLSIGYRMSI
jgi:lycopene beta-cyclase